MMKSQNYTSRQLILSRLECGLNVAFVVLLIVSLLTGRATAAESLVNPPIPIFDVLADTLFGTRLETGVSMNPIRRGIRILTLLTDQLESPGMLRRQTYTTFYPATILALFLAPFVPVHDDRHDGINRENEETWT